MNKTDCKSPPIADISFAQFFEAYKNSGADRDKPDLERLVELVPHLENEIRTRLPTALLLDKTLKTKPAPQPESLKTEIIAGCIIKEEIGRGGMGIVYRAHQPEFDRDVAVKVISIANDADKTTARFRLERQALARLEHPNIVPAYSFTQDSRFAYLVLKLIDGHGLNRLIQEDCDYQGRVQVAHLRSNWSTFAALAADVASGLQHAHDAGLVHRDIKPGNLLLDHNGKVWITDFGLAKMGDFGRALSQTGDMVGTPRYMAPEQLRGNSDPRSDIYALGMTLYELATGESARSRDWFPNEQLDQGLPILTPIVDICADIPSELSKVIMKACRFAPEDRYQSAAELEVVLRRFIAGRVPDRRIKKRKPDSVFRREFRLKLAAAAAVSMIVCSAATYFLIPKGQPLQLPQQHSNFNILEIIADGQDNIPGHVIAESLISATEELHLPDAERQELIDETEKFVEQVRAQNFDMHRLEKLISKYNQSHLAATTKVFRLNRFVHGSNLSQYEKRKAERSLHRLAYLTSKERISEEETMQWINSFTNGVAMTNRELANFRPSDSHIRNWFVAMDQRASELLQPGEAINFSDEIKGVFDELFNDPSVPLGGEIDTVATKPHRGSKKQPSDQLQGLDISEVTLKETFNLTDEQVTKIRASIEGRK